MTSWNNELSKLLGFSQTHKIGNIGIIANFVFTYICSSLPYLQYMVLVDIKLDISGCNRLDFKVTEVNGPVPF